MANVENGLLQSAINNAAVGETVVLTSDITLTERVTVSNVVTIDLNGYTITGNINDDYGAIYVGTKGVLTIKDSSVEQTGAITNTFKNAIGNYGIVEIYGGKFIGNYALYNFYYNNSIYGTSTIYGGTFKSINGVNSVLNCGNLTISGGNIEHLNTTNVLVVDGGIIESLYVGVADYNPTNQDTSINSGHIGVLTIADNSTNKVVVSGGTFDSKIDSQYLAEGFVLSYDEGTGTYGAITNSDETGNSGLKVIATSSSRVRDLVIKNGQLIFIQDLKRIAFDFNNTRVFYNQIIELDSEADRQSLENPLNGYYFVIGSACLWYYKDEWVQITEKPKEVLFIGVELPELGQEGKLYVDTDDKEISVWVEESNQYITVANYTMDVTEEDIDNLFK